MKVIKHYGFFLLLAVAVSGCMTVTFISGYDAVLDNTITRIKNDFNLHWIKLSRTLQDEDPNNQKFENFQEYYDHLEVDLITIKDRAKQLDNKSAIVRKQVNTVDSIMHAFVNLHKSGMKDSKMDDRRDIRNGINSSLNAVTKLQLELKNYGKINH